jgi:predicted permease
VSPRFWLRGALVVVQVALSLLLLIGAGLFLRSLGNANAIDPGFDPDNVLMMSFNLELQGYQETRVRAFYTQLLERVRGLPGTISATLSASTPLSMFGSRRGTFIEGYTRRPGEDMEFHYNIVTPEYFDTMRIQFTRGRAFTSADRDGASGVVMVNETFARRFWPGQDPLGKRLSVSGPQGKLLEVVGVTRDGKYNTLGEAPTPFFYLPLWQNLRGSMTLMVRTASEPGGAVATVRGVFRELDRNLPVTDVKTMVEHLGFSLFPARMAATLLGAFGLLAMLLAAIGIYGVMAYSVSQRTRELGVRIALGASRRDVLLLVARQAMRLTLAGIILGLAAAFALTRLLASLLYGLSATDPVTFAGISFLLGGVALFAGFIPAWRATRIDPISALRYE